MKRRGLVVLRESQIKNFCTSLSRTDLETLLTVLKSCLEEKSDKSTPTNLKDIQLSESFLETPIEKLGFKPRTIKQLKKHNIFTVRNITEVGLDRLRLFSRIGEGTVKEIENIVFKGQAKNSDTQADKIELSA